MNPQVMYNEYNRLRQLTHTKILKSSVLKYMQFRCECGCEFETELKYCEQKTSRIFREYGSELSTTFWSHCPVCRKNCHT